MPNIVRRTLLAAAVTATMIPMGFAAEVAYDADVVVIGAGASGTAAAGAAAEKGLKVVTLEKSGMVGGTGKFSEGIFAVESKMQRDWNYGLTKDEAFQKIMNYGHWRGNARMVRAFVDRSADTIDWMMANGVKFEKNCSAITRMDCTHGTSTKAEGPVGSTISSRSTRTRGRRCC